MKFVNNFGALICKDSDLNIHSDIGPAIYIIGVFPYCEPEPGGLSKTYHFNMLPAFYFLKKGLPHNDDNLPSSFYYDIYKNTKEYVTYANNGFFYLKQNNEV